jgi:hypothetical protein
MLAYRGPGYRGILPGVSSQLSSVPVQRRRRAAATAGLAAALLVAVGIVPWTGPAPVTIRVLAAVALAVAALFALVAWELLTSVRADVAELRLDSAAAATLAAAGVFDHGHDHDPDEMHVSDACPSGQSCTHDCATCLGSTWRS